MTGSVVLRGDRWVVRHHVPIALRNKGWPAYVERPLDARTEAEARRAMPAAVQHLKAAFERAEGPPMTIAEMERAAFDEAVSLLNWYRDHPEQFKADDGNCPADYACDIFQEALDDQDYSMKHDAADRIARIGGFPLPPDRREQLAELLIVASREVTMAACALVDAVRGDGWRAATRLPRPDVKKEYERLLEPFAAAAARYRASHQTTWKPGTLRQFDVTTRIFGEHVGDKPMTDIKVDDVSAFFSILATLHAVWGKGRNRRVSLADARRAAPGEPAMGEAAIARHASVLRTIFAAAGRADLVEATRGAT